MINDSAVSLASVASSRGEGKGGSGGREKRLERALVGRASEARREGEIKEESKVPPRFAHQNRLFPSHLWRLSVIKHVF